MNPGTLGTSSSTSIDLVDDTIKCTLVTAAYTPDYANHVYYGTATGLSANIATGTTPIVSLASKTVTGAKWTAASVTFSAITGATALTQMVFWKDISGSPNTSPLICLLDGFSITPNGGDIVVTFDVTNGIFKF